MCAGGYEDGDDDTANVLCFTHEPRVNSIAVQLQPWADAAAGCRRRMSPIQSTLGSTAIYTQSGPAHRDHVPPASFRQVIGIIRKFPVARLPVPLQTGPVVSSPGGAFAVLEPFAGKVHRWADAVPSLGGSSLG